MHHSFLLASRPSLGCALRPSSVPVLPLLLTLLVMMRSRSPFCSVPRPLPTVLYLRLTVLLRSLWCVRCPLHCRPPPSNAPAPQLVPVAVFAPVSLQCVLLSLLLACCLCRGPARLGPLLRLFVLLLRPMGPLGPLGDARPMPASRGDGYGAITKHREANT